MKYLSLLFFMFFFSCQGSDPKGFVVEKRIKPGYVSTTYIKTGQVLVPLTTVIHERYIIYLEDSLKIHQVDVKQNLYENIEIGYYCDFSEKDNPKIFDTNSQADPEVIYPLPTK